MWFKWPDLHNPQIIERTLVLSLSKKDNRVVTVRVVVLIGRCLYLVHEKQDGLREGQVLSRNLELTREIGYNPDLDAEQVFIVYDSLFDARRAFSRINPQYREVEIPELVNWKWDADWLLRQSWTLDEADSQRRSQFVLRAGDRANKHARDRNQEKVAAQGRTRRVALETDVTGRRNIGRIPLMCGAIERGLQRRVQSVRGIGRRMDWRAVVVEHYLDQLRQECFLLRRCAQSALITKAIFEPGSRSAPAMRKLAMRMAHYATQLATIRARPFNRTFRHASHELTEASRLLTLAADAREGTYANLAKAQLATTYRSMCLLEQHWRIEDILTTVSTLFHRRKKLQTDQVVMMKDELIDVLGHLERPDPHTGELIHAGFKRPDTVEDTMLRLRSCIALLSQESIKLKDLRIQLKAACRPL